MSTASWQGGTLQTATFYGEPRFKATVQRQVRGSGGRMRIQRIICLHNHRTLSAAERCSVKWTAHVNNGGNVVMKRDPQLPLMGEPGFRDGAEGKLREQEAVRKVVEDEFRAILDEASRPGKGDKWAILQIIRKLEWRAPR